MAVPFSNTKLRVPLGFQSLLEAVAKEILLQQPTDIISCAALYCDQLLQLREDGATDPIKQAAEIQDRLYNNKSFEKAAETSVDPELDKAAVTIQTKYRQFKAKETAEDLRKQQAATRIQAGFRGYRSRKSIAAPRHSQTEEEALQKEVEGKPLEDEEAEEELKELMSDERADDRIEPAETGRKCDSSQYEPDETSPKESPDQNEPDETARVAAAERIQAGVRGHQTRKQLRAASPGSGVSETIEEGAASPGSGNQSPVASNKSASPRSPASGSRKSSTSSAKSSAHSGKSSADVMREDEEEEEAGKSPRQDYGRGSEGVEALGERFEAGSRASEKEFAPTGADGDNSMEERIRAANKIQAGYRGMKVRRSIVPREKSPEVAKTEEEEEEPPANSRGSSRAELASSPRAASIRDDDKEKVDDEDANYDDDGRVRATNTIQAGYRGYQTRKELRERSEGLAADDSDVERGEEKDGDADPDEVEPSSDYNIQGDQKEDETTDRRSENKEEEQDITDQTEDGADEENRSADDEARHLAATKIQAGVRGMKVRRELSPMTRSGSDHGSARNVAEEDQKGSPRNVGSVQSGRASAGEAANEDQKESPRSLGSVQSGRRSNENVAKEGQNESPRNSGSAQSGRRSDENLRSDEHPESAREASSAVGSTGIDDEGREEARVAASVKIQAGYRGMKVRREFNAAGSVLTNSAADETAATEATAATSTAAVDETAAATPEAASAQLREDSSYSRGTPQGERVHQGSESFTPRDSQPARDVDVDDAIFAMSATRTESGEHGTQSRKSPGSLRHDDTADSTREVSKPASRESEHRTVSGDNPDNIEAAASRIQAGYRGWKTRKELQTDELEGEDEHTTGSDERQEDMKPWLEIGRVKSAGSTGNSQAEAEQPRGSGDLKDQEMEEAATRGSHRSESGDRENDDQKEEE